MAKDLIKSNVTTNHGLMQLLNFKNSRHEPRLAQGSDSAGGFPENSRAARRVGPRRQMWISPWGVHWIRWWVFSYGQVNMLMPVGFE